jgi:hypothetical protein
MKKISKGCLVRLNKNICFTSKNGGKRKYPLTNIHDDDAKIVESRRLLTTKDTKGNHIEPNEDSLAQDGQKE